MSRRRIVVLALVCIGAIVLIRNAWICDDAFISYRTVDNAVHGYGLRWNVAERVQAFTHPLWVLLLIPVYALSGEIFYTAIAVSIALSLVTLWLVATRIAPDTGASVAAVSLLLISKPWVDFAVGGLENPLSHLTICFFLIIYFDGQWSRRRLFLLGLMASLTALTRLDLLALLGPMLVLVLVESWSWRRLGSIALGILPLVGWELFSIVYYGFPFPNTAYAKLAAGIASSDLTRQGLYYTRNLVTHSPITATVIGLAILGGLIHRNRKYWAAVAGLILYSMYIARAGGDFMSGRFFTPVYLVAVCLLVAHPPIRSREVQIAGIVALCLLGLFNPRNPVSSGDGYGVGPEKGDWDVGGIADARAAIYQYSGLLTNWGKSEPPDFVWAREGRALRNSDSLVIIRPGIGMLGFFAGPRVYIVTLHGLSDPLLARLPIPLPTKWRVGHYVRVMPEGYLQSLTSGENEIVDPDLREYYRRLTLITRGDLFSAERWQAIWLVNRGKLDALIRAYWSRPLYRVPYARFSRALPSGTAYTAPACLLLSPSGALIELDSAYHSPLIEYSVDHNDDYYLTILRDDSVVASMVLPAKFQQKGGLRVDTALVPDLAQVNGYDALLVQPRGTDGAYSIGHVRLLAH